MLSMGLAALFKRVFNRRGRIISLVTGHPQPARHLNHLIDLHFPGEATQHSWTAIVAVKTPLHQPIGRREGQREGQSIMGKSALSP